jgi:integrase
MIDHPITREVKVRDPLTSVLKTEVRTLRNGLTRRLINKQIGRIRRMFAWAVEEELLSVTVHQALLRVKGLRKGKSGAREKPSIKPVPEESVEAVLPRLPAMVRAMVQVQRLCGGRPQDIVEMRAIDIDTTGLVWEYHPGRYKTEHHNDNDDSAKARTVFLGPKAQAVLKPYLDVAPTEYLFSPRRSEELRKAERRRSRKTPLWPSHLRHHACRRQARGNVVLRKRYDANSYRKAVRRACQKAGVPVWHPNQLRHSRLTEIRKHFGLEASKACAGHREIATTQHYAEQDRTLASSVMAEIG